MISGIEIDKKLYSTFGLKDLITLSNQNAKIRYELGQNYRGNERFEKAFELASKILCVNFKNKSLWIRVTLWDITEKSILSNSLLLPLMDKLQFNKIVDNSLVLYFFLDEFDLNLVKGLVKSSVGYELGMEDTLNITCFYFNLDLKIILNIYDDRGLDVLKIGT